MTRHYLNLASASDWSCRVGNLIQPIRSTTQIWVVTRHKYGISAVVSQTSFGGKTSGSVAKCRLFSQDTLDIELQKVPKHTIMLFVCKPNILHKHCLHFLFGVKMAPRETENNAYAKFLGDKQRVLSYVMVFSVSSGQLTGEGKSRNQFAEWHVACLAE